MPKNRKICIDAYFFYGKYARLHIFRMSLDMLKRKAIETFESIAFLLFYSHRFGKVSRFIHIASLDACRMIGKHLQQHRCRDCR